jgi:hypothetical protein
LRIIRHVIGKVWEKVRSLFGGGDGDEAEPMPEEWAEPPEGAEQLEPGRDIQAGQIGMFS